MKKLLITASALTLVAGAASANVTIAGSGYMGVGHDSGLANKNYMVERMQLDFSASKTTDSGLTFHGSFRARSTTGSSNNNTNTNAPTFNGGAVGVTAGGLDVSFGNVTDAYDASGVVYNSEIGICGCGGEVVTNFAGSSSNGAGNQAILVTYSMGSFIGRAGYQQNNGNGVGRGESSVGVEYTMGTVHVAAGYLEGYQADKVTKYHATYGAADLAIGNSHVGVLLGNNHVDGGNDNGTIATLYGNTKMGATTIQAFVSNAQRQLASETTKTTYGVGAKYDLGSGAAIVGNIQKDRNKDTLGDLGVTFSF